MLTKGSLVSIKNNEDIHDPVWQVFDIKKESFIGTNKGYSLHISDGQNMMCVMLATQLNNMISSNMLNEFSIILMKHYIVINSIDCPKKKKQIIILVDLVILISGDVLGLKIGNPKPITDNSNEVIENSSPFSADTSILQYNSVISHLVQENVRDNSFHKDMDNSIDSNELYQEEEVEHLMVTTIDPRINHTSIGMYFTNVDILNIIVLYCFIIYYNLYFKQFSIFNNNCFNKLEKIKQKLTDFFEITQFFVKCFTNDLLKDIFRIFQIFNFPFILLSLFVDLRSEIDNRYLNN